MKISKNQ